MREKIDNFHSSLQPYFDKKYRDMPWRELPNDAVLRFYQVLVSELMLQQTQVSRVIDKYSQWMVAFPTLDSLSKASFSDVLATWSGLGYSRRARYLHEISKQITPEHLPIAIEELTIYKGIGSNTAGAVLAYYANTPTIFIETNIRTVLFHHFFNDVDTVDDKQLYDLLSTLVDQTRPRLWYWAMMDYGTELKKNIRNISKSKHYRKQTAFEGSDRQLRSRLLHRLLSGALKIEDALLCVESKAYIIDALCRERMIVCVDSMYMLPD